MQDEKTNMDFHQSNEPAMGELLDFALSLHYELQELKNMAKKHHKNSQQQPSTPVNRKPGNNFYTTEEVKAKLKVSDRTLYSYRKDGTLPAKMVGGKYLYKKETVDHLVNPD